MRYPALTGSMVEYRLSRDLNSSFLLLSPELMLLSLSPCLLLMYITMLL